MTKLKKLKQVDGKIDNIQNSRPQTLEQLWGGTGAGRYSTLDKATYEAGLKDMNKSDLQKHAVTCNLIPIDNRETLITRLVREFEKHINGYKRIPVMKPKQVSAEVIKLMADAR